nr:peptide deformylase [Metamycoplasma hominis]
MQHEYDHLQGKLFIDRINKNQPWKQEKNSHLI